MLRLKILHLCPTPLSGAPVHLSTILNKYSACDSKTILKRAFDNPERNELRWNYDITAPSKDQLREAVEWADIIHYHHNQQHIYPVRAGKKPSVVQFHSPPDRYVPGQTLSEYNGRKLVVAQYQPRFFTDALIVPNMIDIWDPLFMPGEKPADRIRIFYSWATEQKHGWGDKGSEQTIAILNRLQAKYGKKVDVCVVTNRPHRECMAEKRTAHICIDECVTGSYHLQSLEACSVGALVLNNIDDQTFACMRAVNGQNSHPFVRTSLDELFDRLCFYVENPETLLKAGRASRKWMEDFWNPRILVGCYLRAYHNLWVRGAVAPKNEIGNPKSKTSSVAEGYSRHRRTRHGGKSVRELYRKYEGEDLYIFGSGPSLFKVDPEEFRDKICLGINYVFEVIPHLDFILFHDRGVYEALKDVVDNEKFLMPEALWEVFRVNDGPQAQRNQIRRTLTPVRNDRAWIYEIQEPYEKVIDNKCITLEKDAKIFTWSATTHSAIHLAAYMGAKNIFLIGVDYVPYPNGRAHFDSKYNAEYGQQLWISINHRIGDEWLTRELMHHGVHVENIGIRI